MKSSFRSCRRPGACRHRDTQGPTRHHDSIEGRTYEVDRGWLAGRQINVSWSALEDPLRPWAEYEGKRYELHFVDVERNASRSRPPRNDTPDTPKSEQSVAFDPPKALLDHALGRRSLRDPDDDN